MNETMSNIWERDTISIDDGEVTGSARTEAFNGGYVVAFYVKSYEYDGYDQAKQTEVNHAPVAFIQAPRGHVVYNLEPQDSSSAKKAIENARGAAEYAFNNPEEYNL